jgi:hypothetical protein
MTTDIDKEIDTTSQLYHSFYIHKEYINHEEIVYDEINEKPGSFYHPHFINLLDLITKINQVIPNIQWSHYEEFELDDSIECVSFGKVKTDYGILLFQVGNENGEVYSPIHISIELTDFPFIEVKRLCKEYNWFLYHLNSFSYLDPGDDNQVEDDFVSGA